MAQDAAFLVPVVIDGLREADARVPDEFLQAQWTWLPDGETPPAFAHRVRRIAGGPTGRGASRAIRRCPETQAGQRRQAFHRQARHWSHAVGSGGRCVLVLPTCKRHASRLRVDGLGCSPYRKINCGAAIREHEQRGGAGVSLRRHFRTVAERAGEDPGVAGDFAFLVVLAQGAESRGRGDRQAPQRHARSRRLSTQGGQPGAHCGATGRSPIGHARLVGDLRSGSNRHLRGARRNRAGGRPPAETGVAE